METQAPSKKAVEAREYRKKFPDRARESTFKWRRNNPDKFRVISRRAKVKKNYGITLEEYDGMLEQQNWQCANHGCKSPLTLGRGNVSANLDHNHKTGKIRAFLCQNCNHALGRLREDRERILGLLEYLDKYDGK